MRNRRKSGVVAAAGIAAASALAAVTVVDEASAATPSTSPVANRGGTPQALPATVPAPLPANGDLYYLKNDASTTDEPHTVAPDFSDHAVTLPGDPRPGMAWSPDGSKVAIASLNAVTVYDRNFTNPVVVAPFAGAAANYGPRWLPDGSGLAYVSLNLTTHIGAIWTVHADGTGAAELPLSSDITGGNVDEFDILPNGDYLIRNTIHGTIEIEQFHPGASSATLLMHGNVGRVAASPDGTRAAVTTFDAAHPESGYTVGVMDLTTHTVLSVLPNGATAQTPLWSPDGKKVAFERIDTFAQPGGPGTLPFRVTGSHIETRTADGTAGANVTLATSLTTTFPVSWAPVAPRPIEDRVAGSDRIGTAIQTSKLAFSDKTMLGGRLAASAVLSRSDTFADALAGGALAAHKKGPLLLTPTGSLDPAVRDELLRVLAPGSTVYLLGGTSALSDNVLNQVAALGFTPVRVWGPDRDATAVEVAKKITATPHVFLVATGRNFPDALAAGAAAGAQPDTVVLLSDDNTLSPTTRGYLTANHHSGDILLGVGNQGSNALTTAFPVTEITSQLRGHDRFDTAAQLADFWYSAIGAPKTVGVATGYNWPDALGGGALLGAHPGPLLLTTPAGLPPVENTYLSANSAGVQEIVVFGGTVVVPTAAADQVANTAKGIGNWDYRENRTAPPLP